MIVDAILVARAVTAVRWMGEQDNLAMQNLTHMVLYKAGCLEVPSVGCLTAAGGKHDSQTVWPGDWVVKIGEGLFIVCEHEIFTRLFVLCELRYANRELAEQYEMRLAELQKLINKDS